MARIDLSAGSGGGIRAAETGQLQSLHQRVLRGDHEAREELAASLMLQLRQRLRAAFPRVDAALVHDAAVDAILVYLAHPERFDGTRGTALDQFVFVVSWRRLANSVRDLTVVASREVSLDAAAPPNRQGGDRDTVWIAHSLPYVLPSNDLERGELRARALTVATNHRERRAIELLLDGADDAELGDALDSTASFTDERKRDAKRFRDRIRQRWRAAGLHSWRGAPARRRDHVEKKATVQLAASYPSGNSQIETL
jgi:hypothetical protein